MNKKMLWVALTLVLPAICLGQGANPAAPTKCPLKQLASLDITTDGEILVPAVVDGRAGSMVLNVGDGATYLWDSFVKEARLPRQNIGPMMSFQSRSISSVVTIKTLALGSVTFGRNKLFVSPPVWTAPAGATGPPVIGALGMDVLSAFDFELDAAGRKLNIFSHDHCPGAVVYWTSDKYASIPIRRDALGNVFIAVELDGRNVQAMLAMGRDLTTLRKDAAKQLYGFATGPDGSEDRYVAMRMTAPGVSIANVRVSLQPRPLPATLCPLTTYGTAGYRNCAGQYPVEIGRNILRHLRLYFATREKVLYATKADAS